MKMKARKLISLAVCLAGVVSAKAQTPIPPFAGSHQENFDTIAPGFYGGIPVFAGFGLATKLGGPGQLNVYNGISLPALTGPNAMFGQNTNVRITLAQWKNQFGGYFRVPAGAATTLMQVRFYRTGVMIGVPVTAAVNAGAWQWRGWDVAALGSYDEVRIFGNVGLGWVGMDSLRIN